MNLNGKKILLGITGSIAAYKSASLVRLLLKEGASVRVVMTKDACNFITPLTLSTLSKNKVLTGLVDENDEWWNSHVELGMWADLFIIAPASANTIAKFAHGFCNNLITAVYLSARCPVAVAPAMDEDMWLHEATQRNIETLLKDGKWIIPVGSGELASGLVGPGRMAEPEFIVAFIKDFFNKQIPAGRLKGMKALVTAGPTYEAIDPVRFIGNHSSGKMGIALAEALAGEGARVELVLGPSSLQPQHPNVHTEHVTSAKDMLKVASEKFKTSDITVMAAAVADYTPVHVAAHKIKKDSDSMVLELTKTEDILKTLGKKKHHGQVLVGFALETDGELKNATEKLRRKNLDLVVLNSLQDPGAGFRYDTNKITVIDRQEKLHVFPLKSKQEAARDIVELIIKQLK